MLDSDTANAPPEHKAPNAQQISSQKKQTPEPVELTPEEERVCERATD